MALTSNIAYQSPLVGFLIPLALLAPGVAVVALAVALNWGR